MAQAAARIPQERVSRRPTVARRSRQKKRPCKTNLTAFGARSLNRPLGIFEQAAKSARTSVRAPESGCAAARVSKGTVRACKQHTRINAHITSARLASRRKLARLRRCVCGRQHRATQTVAAVGGCSRSGCRDRSLVRRFQASIPARSSLARWPSCSRSRSRCCRDCCAWSGLRNEFANLTG
jgi:hypothetical protein